MHVFIDGCIVSEDDLTQEDDHEPGTQAEDEVAIGIESDKKWNSALFLLRVTQENSLTHDGVDKICESVQWFVDDVLDDVLANVKHELASTVEQIDLEVQRNILGALQSSNIFDGLNSREKYYEHQFNYVVSFVQ